MELNTALLLEKLTVQNPSLTNDEMSECALFFQQDALFAQDYLEEFARFHTVASRHPEPEFFHEAQNIRQSYIYALSSQRNRDSVKLSALYLQSAEYFLHIRAFSECVRDLFNVLENRGLSARTQTAATSMLFSVLSQYDLYETSYPFMQKLKDRLADSPLSPYNSFILDMAFMQLYGFSGETERAENYYVKLKKTNPLPEGITAADMAYLELQRLSIECISLKPHEGDRFARLSKICESLDAKTRMSNLTYSVHLLPILRSVRDSVSREQLMTFYSRIDNFVSDAFDRLNLYTYLFEEIGVQPDEAHELYAKYIEGLKRFYQATHGNQKQVIQNELMSQTLDADYKQKAMTDRLSGLGNRQAYTELFQQYAADKNPLDHSLCLVMMDLDNLKRQNDTYGHEAGDQLIRAATEAMRFAFGEDTELFRYGGDEFVAVLNTDRKQLEETLYVFNAACTSWTSGKSNTFRAKLRVSVGYAFAEEIVEEQDNTARMRALYKLADSRMYDQKALHHSQMEA